VKNLFVADATRLGDIERNLGWRPEVIIVGELLEHLDAPGNLLREIANHITNSGTLLITVPNVFSIRGLLHVMLGEEKNHTDHVAYYSYATMMSLLSRYGLEVFDMRYYRTRPHNIVDRALNVFISPFLALRPYFSEGLILLSKHRSHS